MMLSAAGKPNIQDHLLARATAVFSAILLAVSLGLVWFKVGGGSKGRSFELTGFQSLFVGLGGPSPVRPRGGFTLNGLLAGTLPFVLILLAVVALLLASLLPRVRWARPASVLLCAVTTLLPIAVTLMTFTLLRSSAIQPAFWLVFIAAVSGLCASIAISDPTRASLLDQDTDTEDATP